VVTAAAHAPDLAFHVPNISPDLKEDTCESDAPLLRADDGAIVRLDA